MPPTGSFPRATQPLTLELDSYMTPQISLPFVYTTPRIILLAMYTYIKCSGRSSPSSPQTLTTHTPRPLRTGGLDPRDLKTALSCISFLRKGVVLAYVGLPQNLKDWRDRGRRLQGYRGTSLIRRRLPPGLCSRPSTTVRPYDSPGGGGVFL